MADKPIGVLPEKLPEQAKAEIAAGRDRLKAIMSGDKIPVQHQTNAEIEAGRLRVQHHAERERMIAAKRAREENESAQDAKAKSANADLA